jgi:hypothetical protein
VTRGNCKQQLVWPSTQKVQEQDVYKAMKAFHVLSNQDQEPGTNAQHPFHLFLLLLSRRRLRRDEPTWRWYPRLALTSTSADPEPGVRETESRQSNPTGHFFRGTEMPAPMPRGSKKSTTRRYRYVSLNGHFFLTHFRRPCFHCWCTSPLASCFRLPPFAFSFWPADQVLIFDCCDRSYYCLCD